MNETIINTPRLIGLTGSIASGKSAASDYLQKQGFPIIDADKLGHRVLEPGHEGFSRIIETFGKQILNPDGTVNRPALGGIVFKDSDQLAKLNQISHPLIAKMILEDAQRLAQERADRIVFLEAALLIEANWKEACEQVWLILADPDVAIRRLMQRNGLTKEQAQSRLALQLSNEERTSHSHVILKNDHSLDDLYQQLAKALADL